MYKKILILFTACGMLSGGVAVGMNKGKINKGKRIPFQEISNNKIIKNISKKTLNKTSLPKHCFGCGACFEEKELVGFANCCSRPICIRCIKPLKDCLGTCLCSKFLTVILSKVNNLKEKSFYGVDNFEKVIDKKLLNEFYSEEWKKRSLRIIYAYLNISKSKKIYKNVSPFEAALKYAMSFEMPVTMEKMNKVEIFLKELAKKTKK